MQKSVPTFAAGRGENSATMSARKARGYGVNSILALHPSLALCLGCLDVGEVREPRQRLYRRNYDASWTKVRRGVRQDNWSEGLFGCR